MSFFFSFSECSTKLGLINKEDVKKIRDGENLDNIALKMALSVVSLCTNLHTIRNEPTKRAIEFIQSITNGDYNVNRIIRKKPKVTYRESSYEDGEITPNRLELGEPSKTTIEHNVECSLAVPENFDLDNFVVDLIEEEKEEGNDLFENIIIDNEPDMIDELFA